MKAVISVTGRDSMGIIAKVSCSCAEFGANIIDISQTVLSEYFAMIIFVDKMAELGKAQNLEIHTMHEDIFNSMHRI